METCFNADIGVEIRLMGLGDISQVMEIGAEVGFNSGYSSYWVSELVSDRSRAWVAATVPRGEVVGYLHAWFVVGEAEITEIGVRRNLQGKGIGTLLMDRLFSQAQTERITRIFLDVRVGNEAALNLYRKFGFSIKGQRKGYYRGQLGADALIMEAIV